MAKLNRLKAVLAEQDKTSKWLAEQVGKSACTVSKWCNNSVQPDLQTLDKIAKLLKVDVKTLLKSNSSYPSNPQPIGFSGILLAKRQNSFYCTYFLHNRDVADTKSPYPIKRLEVIRWFNQKSMVFNQSLS